MVSTTATVRMAVRTPLVLVRTGWNLSSASARQSPCLRRALAQR
jgi:hypothetical protein